MTFPLLDHLDATWRLADINEELLTPPDMAVSKVLTVDSESLGRIG